MDVDHPPDLAQRIDTAQRVIVARPSVDLSLQIFLHAMEITSDLKNRELHAETFFTFFLPSATLETDANVENILLLPSVKLDSSDAIYDPAVAFRTTSVFMHSRRKSSGYG